LKEFLILNVFALFTIIISSASSRNNFEVFAKC
jgi:hypothetical protein